MVVSAAISSEKQVILSQEQANSALAKPKGLASSRFANASEGGDDGAAAEDNAAEGEDDDDHSSAALALVREPLA